MSNSPHRREIWRVRLDKDRPVVVVSRETTISSHKEVIIVPFSTTKKLGSPAGVRCKAGQGGLSEDCTALCPLVNIAPKDRFKEHMGDLSEEIFRLVLKGVIHAIHYDEFD